MPPRLALALAPDRLVVAATAEQVKAVLKGEKRTRTLTDTDDYQALLKHFRPTGPVRLVVNVPRVLELVKGATTGPELESLRKTLRMVGADCLGSVVGHMRVGASSYDSKAELLFLMSGQRTGIAQLLSMENLSTTPAANVPAWTFVYAACNVNVPKLIDQIEQAMREVDPAGADKLHDGMAQKLPNGDTVDYRKEFLDHLRGPLTASFALTKPISISSGRVLLGLGHGDQAALARFLGGANLQAFLQPRDVRGTQVYDVQPLPPLVPAGLALAATKDRLVLGNVPAVEAALAPAAEPLSATEVWKRAARVAPEQAWLIVYVDQRGLLQGLLEVAKKKDDAAAGVAGGPDFVAAVVMMAANSLSNNASGGAAGGFEKFLSYAGQTIYAAATTPDGIQFTVVQLKPEK